MPALPSLALPFSPPRVEAPAPPPAKPFLRPTLPAGAPAPARPPVSEAAPPEETVFLVRDERGRRRELLRALSERVAMAVLRRDGTIEGRDGEAWFRGRLEQGVFILTFTDRDARTRFLPLWQAAARELGLVEPD